ncbi:MAG TPA: cytochrome d ubiquinol oxidase subunit II [Candidatus Aquilonibacter sp.]|nr:cytochrome d ubiquinol oxidase subunit II [Candidatus Aquilonibacter sp.]
MGFIWFWLVAIMLVAYVVLDGFDLGVGVLHVFLPRSEQEKQLMLRSIGPVWDGNEVWLLAGGGTLYFAFPLLYASAFSGFYLALMIVLWLLIMRGAAIELRMKIDSGVWRSFFDGVFFISSALLAVFFGAALANVIRGVPLQADGYFFLPLWTDWRVGAHPGILDWYTVMGGVVALAALALHGALYVAVKTEGDLQQRARAFAHRLWLAVLLLTLLSLPASVIARPDTLANYRNYPLAFAVPLLVFLSLIGMPFFSRKSADRSAFLCSCAYLTVMLVGAAIALYPRLLPSTTDATYDITIDKALSGPHTLHVGLIWWTFGILCALTYFVIVYRMFRGKVSLDNEGYEH